MANSNTNKANNFGTAPVFFTAISTILGAILFLRFGYAVGHGQFESIVKTTNGGETWNTINSKTTSGLNAVYFSDENSGLVFGENGIVLKTTTGGVTGFEETKQRLENGNWEFRCSNVPDTQIRQIFLVDPNGVKLELNFKF